MKNLQQKIKDKLSDLNGKYILIHSDITSGFNIKYQGNTHLFLEDHYQSILDVCGKINIWMPAFNYDFCKTGVYSLNTDVSQVGVLSDFFRKEKSNWRSPVPVFSISGTGSMPNFAADANEIIEPFGKNSLFDYLFNNSGLIMFYGIDTVCNTMNHYIESVSNQLIYRYDKEFKGEIVYPKHKKKVVVKYHVRPLNLLIEYDSSKIQNNLISNKKLFPFVSEKTKIFVAKASDLVEYCVNQIKQDPFYLLTQRSREVVYRKYKELKRPFLITDFE